MSETVKLNVGSIEEMGGRFVGAWHNLERGESACETNLTFFDLGSKGYSQERLIGFLTKLGMDVEIVVRPRASKWQIGGTVSVVFA
jgi:hypothetical protein